MTKKIFPALQSMVRLGELEIPVIGVAKEPWTLDQLRDRMRRSLEEHGGLDAATFDRICGRLRYVSGDYADPATLAALQGDGTLFTREDDVDEAWRIVDPLLRAEAAVYEYDPGTWGPRAAERLATDLGGWHSP